MNRERRRGVETLRHGPDTVRVPPMSIEAEQAVLGGLMLAPDSWDVVAEILLEEDFYRRDHRLIYRAIGELAEKGRPYDAVTLGEWFESLGLAEQVAGGAYLIELASTTPSAANIKAYAKIVRDKATLRGLIEVGTQIVNDGFQPEGREAEEVVAAAEQQVFALAEHGRVQQRDYVMPKEGLRDAFQLLQERYENQSGITGLPSGLYDFDQLTAGLQDTDLIVLAARPSMGKTALALGVAEHAARTKKVAVGVFSMEMSAQQLYLRLVASRASVDAQRLRTGQLEDEDWSKISAASRELVGLTILVDETPALSPEVLRAKARRMKREHNIGLLVVDYMQLMQVPGSKENRANDVAEISRGLKALAKELKIPVIALSQLNRSLEQRADKRPVMADLRESGSIEQDADMIVFIYRDEYYNKENSPDKGLAELIIAKQRTGPTGSVKVRFEGRYVRFDNAAERTPGF